MHDRQRMPRSSAKRVRHGAAAVEFAVIAPLFFMLLAGILEFGQAFRIEHLLSSACRRGARSAIVAGATNSKVETRVKAQCVQMLRVSATSVTVTVTVNGSTGTDVRLAEEGDEIAVTVSIPYSKAGVGFYANTFSSSTLSSTCILEHE